MKPFDHVSVTNDAFIIMKEFRDKFQSLYDDIDKLNKSREISLAITKLEEASMWLNKGICMEHASNDKAKICP